MTRLLKALRRARDHPLVPRGRSVAAVALAMLLVVGAAGAGVFGPTAQRTAEENGPVGEAEAIACGGVCVAGAGIAAGALVGYATNEYLSGDPTSETYTRADKLETQTEVYAHAKSIGQDSELFTTTVNNQAGDGMRTIAWSKGKLAVIESMNNAESQSMATDAGKNATQEYYAVTEKNVVTSWNKQVETMDYINGVWLNHGELSSSPFQHGDGSWNYRGTQNATYTLVNGTEVDVKLVKMGDGSQYNAIGPFKASRLSGETYYNHAPNTGDVRMDNPDGDDNTTSILSSDSYAEGLTSIEDGNSQMESNIEMYTNNTYDEYSAGDINTSQMMDPTTLSQEMSTQYNSTGYYAYAGADLAVLGTDGDLNKSMSIETSSGKTLNGTLFTDWQPSSTDGSYETGTWYTPPDDQMVYVATNDGLVLVQEDFRINSMRNTQTDEEVNSTSLQEYNRQTADVTLTQEQLDKLLNLRQKYDEMEQDAATGGDGGLGLGSDLNSTHAIGLLAIVALLAVVMRD